jgi:hypothetical protein
VTPILISLWLEDFEVENTTLDHTCQGKVPYTQPTKKLRTLGHVSEMSPIQVSSGIRDTPRYELAIENPKIVTACENPMGLGRHAYGLGLLPSCFLRPSFSPPSKHRYSLYDMPCLLTSSGSVDVVDFDIWTDWIT